METPGRCRGKKYIEDWLEKKVDGKWINYWAVVRGSAIFFFKDPDTNLKGNFVGGLEFGAQCVPSQGKNKKDSFEFEVKIGTGKRHLFRTKTDILRDQWLHALALAAHCRPPDPLPGGIGFNPSNSNNENDYHTIQSVAAELPSMGTNVAPGLNEAELQKKVTLMQRSTMSFSAFYRKKGRKQSKQEEVPQGPRPDSVGADGAASSDGRVYDIFQTMRPSWYLGKMTRSTAEEYLQEQLPGTFLVRDSETVKSSGAYTLSLRHFERCRHHKIETIEQGTLVIKGYDHKTFPTLELLVDFFVQSQRKDIELKPYVPSVEAPVAELDKDDGPQSPSRTVGDGCETQIQENQQQLDRSPSLKANTAQNSYENLSPPERDPPLLPSRKIVGSPRGYENIPEKGSLVDPPPKKVSTQAFGYQKNITGKEPPQLPKRDPPSPNGYQNVPPKQTNSAGRENLSGKRSSGVPDVPPTRQPSSRGYQNIPPKQTNRNSGAPSGISTALGYENASLQEAVNATPPLPPRVAKTMGYENVPEKGGDQTVQSLPRDARPFGYQNIPSKAQPRPKIATEEPPPISTRPRPPRRAETLPVLFGDSH